MKKNSREADEMERSEWVERRRRRGIWMPLAYLTLEVTFMVLLIYIVNCIGLIALTILATILAIYYFFSSCLPRFYWAIERQKHIYSESIRYSS